MCSKTACYNIINHLSLDGKKNLCNLKPFKHDTYVFLQGTKMRNFYKLNESNTKSFVECTTFSWIPKAQRTKIRQLFKSYVVEDKSIQKKKNMYEYLNSFYLPIEDKTYIRSMNCLSPSRQKLSEKICLFFIFFPLYLN